MTMSTINVPAVSTADFQAAAVQDDNGVSVRLAGNADVRVMASLDTMLRALSSELERLLVPEVVVDMRNLQFMNSSCFKSFVTWLGQVQEMEPGRQYRIRFLSDANKHWQKRSLAALSCFAMELVRVES
jgi:hypothetical protein